MADIDTITAIIIAAIGAGSAVLGGLTSSLANFILECKKNEKEQRKRFFDMKKESYYNLFEVIGAYIYTKGAKTDAMLPKLQIAANEAQLVGNEEVASLIKEGWEHIGEKEFIEEKKYQP